MIYINDFLTFKFNLAAHLKRRKERCLSGKVCPVAIRHTATHSSSFTYFFFIKQHFQYWAQQWTSVFSIRRSHLSHIFLLFLHFLFLFSSFALTQLDIKTSILKHEKSDTLCSDKLIAFAVLILISVKKMKKGKNEQEKSKKIKTFYIRNLDDFWTDFFVQSNV